MVPEETLERAAVDDVSPRYLRKQKPAEVKRRRSRPAGSQIRHGVLAFLLVIGVSGLVGLGIDLFLYTPAVLLHPGQVEISGEHFVSRDALMSVFSADMGRSALRVPLDRRLAAIEQIPWVKQATIERVLPDCLIVQVVERQPVAFLSTDAGLKLIDDQGVILDRPQGVSFNLPVITGIGEQTPVDERANRVSLFADLLKQIQTVRPDAASEVSEANLAKGDDVQVTLAGARVLAGQGPVLVHFGNTDFANRFRQFLANFSAWQAQAGNVASVDFRYDGQALVTPGVPMPAQAGATTAGSTPAAALPAAQPQTAKAQRNSIAVPEMNGKRSVQQ